MYTVRVIEEADLPDGVDWIVTRVNGGSAVVYVKRSRLPAWGIAATYRALPVAV